MIKSHFCQINFTSPIFAGLSHHLPMLLLLDFVKTPHFPSFSQMFSFCQLPASAAQVTSRQEFVELFLSEVVMLGGLVLAHYKQLLGC